MEAQLMVDIVERWHYVLEMVKALVFPIPDSIVCSKDQDEEKS